MIAIKDMEIPKRCIQCPMHNNSNDYCKVKHEFASLVRGKDDCPLVEIGTCKDCKHRTHELCPNYRHFVDDDFYCADYEKRGNEE